MKAAAIVMTLMVALVLPCRGFKSAAGQAAGIIDPTVRPPDETSIVRVYYADLATGNKVLISFEPQLLETNYEGRYHILEVTKEEMARLVAAGLRVEPDEDWAPPPSLSTPEAGTQTISGYPCYRTVEESFAAAQAIVAAHPNLAAWIDVGDSWEKNAGGAGYDMMVLKLTNSAIAGDKPRLFVTAGIHAREYATAELVTRFGEYLVNNYGADADATWILDYHEIHLLLQTNPDGRKRAETGLSWRKNTRDNCWYSSPPDGDGIDLNRNFAFQWGCCGGSSGTACSSTYRGSSAGSEPETQAVRNYLGLIFPDQRGADLTDPADPATATGIYLDIHSYGQLVLWPWGFTSSAPPNATQLQTLGRKFAYYNSYTPQQAYGLYPTDGTADSYAYGELGVAAYNFETGTEFFQACDYFENVLVPANMPALVYAAKVVRTPYLTPAGPDATALTVNGPPVSVGEAVTLTASIDDTRYSIGGGSEPAQSIATAEYYVDVPPWVNGAEARVMVASDGSLDSSIESVVANLDTTGWNAGNHILFVRGQDSGGNWGAPSAIFLPLSGPTDVELRSFTAAGEELGIVLAWESSSESHNLGFNLYRASKADGPKTQINEDLIPSLVPPGSCLGVAYSYHDRPVRRGIRYFYWLEPVDLYGRAQLHGPVEARAN